MIINRIWAMPNRNTFKIKPIKNLINKYKNEDEYSVDPFANTSTVALVTNDINNNYDTDYNMDALEFLKTIKSGVVDKVYYDPPFSFTQSKRKYGTSSALTTNQKYWSNVKKEIARILKVGGICISCGWNSGGIGKNNGFEIQEILLVPHGSGRNDTIVTVDKKIYEQTNMFDLGE